MNLDQARVLVTGGAGFIGSRVTERLLEEGADVHIVDNFFSGREELVPEEASFERVDVRDEALIDAIVSYDPTAIAHLAALHYVPYCNDNPEETFEVNVMGTRNVLDAAREAQSIEQIVYTSSAAVYPPREVANSEDSMTAPTDVYGKTKLVGEDLLRLYHCESGVDSVSARLFNVYGPNETNPHLIPAILEQLGNGSREVELGNLTPKRDFIHVDDIAGALVAILETVDDGYHCYNVGTGTEFSVREVVETVGSALGDQIRIEQDHDRTRDSDRSNLRADTAKIQNELGWQARTDFVAGIRDLLEEYQIRSEQQS